MIRFGRHEHEPRPEPTPRKDYSPLGEIGLTTPSPAGPDADQASGRATGGGSGPGGPSVPGGPAGPHDKPPRRPRKWRRRILLTTLGLVLVLSGMLMMMRRAPEAWRDYGHLSTDVSREQHERTIRGFLDRLEAQLRLDTAEGSGIGIRPRIPGELAQIDPDSPFADLTARQIADMPFDQTTRITLNNEELNALMVQWFDLWTVQRGFDKPQQLAHPPVVVALHGKLMFAFKATIGSWSQVFGGEVRIVLHESGMAEGSVHRFTMGSLPVPLHQVGVVLRDDLDNQTAERVGNWLVKLERFEFRPVLELEHRRRARVTEMLINDDDTVTLALRVQDHQTYKRHNTQLAAGTAGPNDAVLPPEIAPAGPGETGFADVPATTE